MTRKQAYQHIKVAGYSNDEAAAMRIYTENRISFEQYQKAWNEGIAQRLREERCAGGNCG